MIHLHCPIVTKKNYVSLVENRTLRGRNLEGRLGLGGWGIGRWTRYIERLEVTSNYLFVPLYSLHSTVL